MTISTKFIKYVGKTEHLQLDTACLNFAATPEGSSLQTEHKGVIKSTINKTSQRFLEKLLGVAMPVGYRYEIKKHCNNPNCCNPYHMTFEKRTSENKNQARAELQKTLWADEEHRADRIKKIRESHMSEENRLVHSWVFKKLHENNYAFEDADGNKFENVNKSEVMDHLRLGRTFVNRTAIYVSNEELQLNKKFSTRGIKGRTMIMKHLENGWNVGYNGKFTVVDPYYMNDQIMNDLPITVAQD